MDRNVLLKNKFVNQFFRRLVPLTVFDSKKRRALKQLLLKYRVEDELNAIQSKYSEYWIFDLFFPWGDLGIACALMKEFKAQNGGKILVLTNSEARARVARLFPAIDEVVVVSRSLYDYMFQNPNFEIEKGKYFEINHWKFVDAPRYKSANFLELYGNMFGLKNHLNLEKPVFPEELKQKVENIFASRNFSREKTVLISPISNSFNLELINKNFWLNLANEYEKNGLTVVFNSPDKTYGKYETIFLPMEEQLYFCSLCRENVAIRSGFNDILAIMGLENLRIYYPKSMFFRTITKLEQLTEFKRAFLDEEDKTFDENMFRITSVKMFGLNKTQEVIVGGKQACN